MPLAEVVWSNDVPLGKVHAAREAKENFKLKPFYFVFKVRSWWGMRDASQSCRLVAGSEFLSLTHWGTTLRVTFLSKEEFVQLSFWKEKLILLLFARAVPPCYTCLCVICCTLQLRGCCSTVTGVVFRWHGKSWHVCQAGPFPFLKNDESSWNRISLYEQWGKVAEELSS